MDEFIDHGHVWLLLIIIGVIVLDALYVLWDRKQKSKGEQSEEDK